MSQKLVVLIKNDFYELQDIVDNKSILNKKVVCETPNGLQIGEVFEASNKKTLGQAKFKRVASSEDLNKNDKLYSKKDEVVNLTNNLIKKYKLEMKIVDVDFILDNSKVIISFVCEDRVDFRDLVKDLASNLKARIELKQIGIRDQAKVCGAIGICGREVCCRQFLDDFDKVSIKMAKVQGLSLNPAKISGVCGRLMCCLSYENDVYKEISDKMPKLNSLVKTKDGNGVVVFNNILKQLVSVKITNENDVKINEYPLNEIEIVKVVKDKK